MEGFSAKIARMESTMSLYGRDIVIAFAVIVLGLILIKWINQGLKRAFKKLPISAASYSLPQPGLESLQVLPAGPALARAEGELKELGTRVRRYEDERKKVKVRVDRVLTRLATLDAS